VLTKWELHNFKSIKTLNDLRLTPVTILAGTNSSGKTTLLQSILLVAQTLGSPVTARPLILNGEPVKLGTWSDIPHCDTPNESVSIGCSLSLPDKPADYGVSLRSELWTTRVRPHARRMIEGITNVELYASFVTPRHKTGVPEPSIERVQVVVERARPMAKGTPIPQARFSITARRRKMARSAKQLAEWKPLLPVGVDYEALSYIIEQTVPEAILGIDEDQDYLGSRLVPTTNIGATFRHFLPVSIVQRYDATSRQLRTYLRDLFNPYIPQAARSRTARDFSAFIKTAMFAKSERIPQDSIDRINRVLDVLGVKQQFAGASAAEFTKFLAAMSGTLRPYERQKTELPMVLNYILRPMVSEQARRFAIEATPGPDFSQMGAAILEDFFSNRIRYLGPLRDDPKVIYALPPTPDIPDVGVKGQYTAVVLDRNKNHPVRYIDPATRKERKGNLQEAVVSWLRHMDMLESVSTEESGKLGYKLNVRMPYVDRELDLMTVGVGASQVLPILVMALLAPPGTLLILEQPEIHLHPRVQSLLGDFFLSMGQVGKQCLVETHSEYLVKQLCLRIAEARNDEILKLVKMYFVERQGNASIFREVTPNEYGAVLEWPTGFFDEGTLQAESIIRVASKKRKDRLESSNNEDSS
jgi:predicted ATPase